MKYLKEDIITNVAAPSKPAEEGDYTKICQFNSQ
jgi:hypothetical protein